jgi:hypothetical protein
MSKQDVGAEREGEEITGGWRNCMVKFSIIYTLHQTLLV